MDPRLLDYYNRELQYFREMGAEFAAQFPKVAARLTMSGIDVADPYVERLLEGASFLTARVLLKMDAEFPRFSQRLLEVVYPAYLAPTPSVAVVEVVPKLAESALAQGFLLPRNSTLRSQVIRSQDAVCEFRTAHDVTLWPLSIAGVEMIAAPPDLPLSRLRLPGVARGALRIRLRTPAEMPVSSLALDRLTFFLAGADEIATRLHELLFTRAIGVLVHEGERPVNVLGSLPASSIVAEGLDDAQSLLPYPRSAFGGYRLLQEYFAFPARFLFFTLGGLGPSVRKAVGETLDITVLLDQAVPDLERVVDDKQLALNATPAINLFPKRADRIAITGQRFEYHLVVDRAAPLDYEVWSVTRVIGHAAGATEERVFRPFYQTLDDDGGGYGAYYSLRREPRLLSDIARRRGTRAAYIGSEVFLSLVDQHEAPFSSDLRQLSVEVLATNRDLPLLMRVGGAGDFMLTTSAPVDGVRVIRGPSRPSQAIAEREIAWRLIGHLALNYLALTDLDAGEGAKALRELLELYSVLGDNSVASHAKGVSHVALSPVTRRLPQTGPLAFGRGVQVTVTVDETAFGGTSPYLLATVLDRLFARHVSINTFTQTVLASIQRGRVAEWPPRIGRRPAA